MAGARLPWSLRRTQDPRVVMMSCRRISSAIKLLDDRQVNGARSLVMTSIRLPVYETPTAIIADARVVDMADLPEG